MRITGGTLTGRTLKCPPGIIRPAMDRMRESLFSILGDLTGKSFLDLFSGSGMLAVEAASRGAVRIDLCEKDKLKIPVILENILVVQNELDIKIRCHFMPVEYFIKRCKDSFDIIFFDPPFAYKFHEELLIKAAQNNMLLSGGTIVVHRPEEHKMSDEVGMLRRIDTRAYGRSILDFYKEI
ncbi:MAG: 16S rRNA (guanine(966)-N(2))-methyltransferase RsmD [Treponema sp.]|nr:16S rRNA (guanine(966)-N(2))-methyltransferase RsmD [Treponema sp.]